MSFFSFDAKDFIVQKCYFFWSTRERVEIQRHTEYSLLDTGLGTNELFIAVSDKHT